MAKSKKLTQLPEKEPFVDLTQRFQESLYKRLQKYKKAKSFTSEQEVVRVGMDNWLTLQGY